MCNEETILSFHNGPLTNKNKFKNWVAEIKKKKTRKKLKEEDANLKSETVQCSLKEYVSKRYTIIHLVKEVWLMCF